LLILRFWFSGNSNRQSTLKRPRHRVCHPTPRNESLCKSGFFPRRGGPINKLTHRRCGSNLDSSFTLHVLCDAQSQVGKVLEMALSEIKPVVPCLYISVFPIFVVIEPHLFNFMLLTGMQRKRRII
jgi:hypothetical protein